MADFSRSALRLSFSLFFWSLLRLLERQSVSELVVHTVDLLSRICICTGANFGRWLHLRCLLVPEVHRVANQQITSVSRHAFLDDFAVVPFACLLLSAAILPWQRRLWQLPAPRRVFV